MLKTAHERIKKSLNRLLKGIKTFYKKKPKILISILVVAIFFVISLGIYLYLKPKPNDDIFFLSSSSTAILGNKNPSFNVNFGKREDPDSQWVRFEAKSSTQNPFEEKNEKFFTKIINLVKPKKEYGIEMSLQGVNLSETEKLEMADSNEMVKTVAEIVGTDEVKTSTELIESGRVIGEYTKDPVSKKTVLNEGVADGVDIEYQILQGLGLKEEIIIRDLEAYTKDCEGNLEECKLPLNEFVFDLKLDEGLKLRKGWFTLKGVSTETYYFEDSDGNYVAHFLPNWAVDSSGEKTYNVISEVEEKEDGNYRVEIIVDINWLFSTERVYPVRIDPSIVHDTKSKFDEGVFNRTKSVDGPRVEIADAEGYLIDANTVGYWKLEEETGSGAYLLDSSGNDNHGTPVESVSVKAKVGNGRMFDGVNDYVDAGNDSSLSFGTGNFSIEIWVKTLADVPAGNLDGIVAKYNVASNCGPWIQLDQNEFITFGWRGSIDVQGYTSIRDGKWHHIVAQRTGSTSAELYLDGVLHKSTTVASALTSDSADNLSIGRINVTGRYFNGVIDEVRISNIARTAEEIQVLYSRGLSRYLGEYISPVIDLEASSTVDSLSWTELGVHTGDGETVYSTTDLLAQWDFNETSGTTAVSGGSCGTSCNGGLNYFASTGSQDAAVQSGWTYNNRKWGEGALMFDGGNDYVYIPYSTSPFRQVSAITYDFWVQVNGGGHLAGTSVSGGHGTGGITLTNSVFGFYWTPTNPVADNSVNAAINLSYGEWYHIVFTMDYTAKDCNLYINGEIVPTTLTRYGDANWVPQTSYNQAITDLIGARAINGTVYLFKGTIDSFRVFSRILSASEVLSNYQAGNIEFQYRTSVNGSTWGAWNGGSESSIDNMDDTESDWDMSTTSERIVSLSDDTVIKMEGDGALRIDADYMKAESNTLGYWKFEEESGSGAYLLDSSGNNYHGTPTGTTFTDGYFGGGRSFDKTGPDKVVTADIDVTTYITLEAWINTSGANTSDTGIIDKTGAYYLRLAGTGGSNDHKIYFAIGTDSITSSVTMNDSQWHHVVGVYNGSTMKVYSDGVEVATGNRSGAIPTNNDSVVIGCRVSCNTSVSYNGLIDEARVMDIALTADEIADIYSIGKYHYISKDLDSGVDLTADTKVPFYIASDELNSNIEAIIGNTSYANYEVDANTIGLWEMEEMVGTGAYIKDSSSNANNGTPTGTSYVSDGRIGGARNFDGSNDSINVGSAANLDFGNNGAFTFSGWVKPTTLVDYGGFVSKNTAGRNSPYSYMTTITSAGGLRVYNGSSWIDVCTSGLVAGKWSYIAYVYNGTTIYGYINGFLCGSAAFAYTDNAAHDVTIGSWYSPVTSYDFNGAIDEVRISNIARTPSEIREAYEVGKRTYKIRIDFKADLQSSNLIADSDDLSFTISETEYGATDEIENLNIEDKIIVKETSGNTEYIAQGIVDSVDVDTGAVTVTEWDTGSTFPSSGYTIGASVFKWQEEFFDLRGILSEHYDDISRLTFRIKNDEPTNFWIDDIKNSTYFTDSSGSSFTPLESIRYFQYKVIFTSLDAAVTPYISSVQINYSEASTGPTMEQIMRHGKWFNSSGEKQTFWWAKDGS